MKTTNSNEAAEIVAKIQASRRPVILFDLCEEMYEVTTAADADGLHKWQKMTATGIMSKGCDTLQNIALMIAG